MLLKRQQIRLLLLKAARVIFTSQDNLRHILLQTIPGCCQMPDPEVVDAASNVEDGASYSGSNQLLMQKLMQAATQPSPVKAIFSREELESAALAVLQHLIAKSSRPCPASLSHTSPPPSQPPSLVDYKEMGGNSEAGYPCSAFASGRRPLSSYGAKPMQKAKRMKATTEEEEEPPSLIVLQLSEMGFSRRKVEYAFKELGTNRKLMTS